MRAAFAALRQLTQSDDVVLVLLIGHGDRSTPRKPSSIWSVRTLSADEWAELVKPIAGRLVFVEHRERQLSVSRSAGRPRPHRDHRERLARRRQFETVFPRVLHRGASSDEAADARQERQGLDLGGVRLRERRREGLVRQKRPAGDRASAARRHGDGMGRESRRRRAPTARWRSVTYLQPDGPSSADRRIPSWRAAAPPRRAREQRSSELRRTQAGRMPPDEYDASSKGCCSSSRGSISGFARSRDRTEPAARQKSLRPSRSRQSSTRPPRRRHRLSSTSARAAASS